MNLNMFESEFDSCGGGFILDEVLCSISINMEDYRAHH